MSIQQPANCRRRKHSLRKDCMAVFACVLSSLSAVPSNAAENNLYAFSTWPAAAPAGSYPLGTLLRDSSGALYSATWYGGQYGYGTIFKLAPPAVGQTQWSISVLHSFNGGSDGGTPNATLAMDSTGAIYGTAGDGGALLEGLAFKLTPPINGATNWSYTIIHTFSYNFATGNNDGAHPSGGLIMDKNGALYGTTNLGGVTTDPYGRGFGTVFRLTPLDAGKTTWQETVLYRFTSVTDGTNPMFALTLNGAGALFGSTLYGGTGQCTDILSNIIGCGTVFKLTPPALGQAAWTKSTLHSFALGTDGQVPEGRLLLDAAGAVYGATTQGGAATCSSGCGVIYKLTPPPVGQTAWTESILHSFTGLDGASPQGGLIWDATGAVFGTASGGGSIGYGVVFKLVPPLAGQQAWTETVLFNFDGYIAGTRPIGELVRDATGRFFGVANSWGPNPGGTIYQMTP